ncbi:MAG: hypothetical protein MH825_05755 [Cyanobacteria bacterium]|nr:hypothetical protein [Cyanobacteriota bacterium]
MGHPLPVTAVLTGAPADILRRLIPVLLPPIPPRVWSRLLWALLSAIALLSWAEPATPNRAPQAVAPAPLPPEAAEVEAAVRSLQRQVETLTQQLAQATESSPERPGACKNEKNLKSPSDASS